MKRAISYTDAHGRSHNSPEAATVSDLAALFTGSPRAVGTEIATLVLAQRKEIERIFAEHDDATKEL